MKLEYAHEDVRYKVYDVSGGEEASVFVDAFGDFNDAREARNHPEVGQALIILEERVSFSRRVVG